MEMSIIAYLFVHLVLIVSVISKNVPNIKGHKKWHPSNPNLSLKEFLKTNGLKKDDYDFVSEMLPVINQLIARSLGIKTTESEANVTHDDVMFTPAQVIRIYKEYTKKLNNHGRRKRKLKDFHSLPGAKWPLPIQYKIDGDFNSKEVANILAAIKQWETFTCTRFKQIKDISKHMKDYHILFVRQFEKCSSYVGRINPADTCDTLSTSYKCPQLVKLDDGCADNVGTPLHEIGHILGLEHEHERPDRDKYVVVVKRNIRKGNFVNFRIESETKTLGVPYDFGSIMHYEEDQFSKEFFEKKTLIAVNPLFQQSMGQEAGLSFYDIKIVNMAYCATRCPSLPCERGGIVNPNNCNTCLCPDGFGGKFCEHVAPSDSVCGKKNKDFTITVDSTEENCITMPRIKTPTQCNWLLKAPRNQKIDLYFKEKFNVYCCYNITCCQDWVEIKYTGSLDGPGPRFCCYTTPKSVLTSDKNEAVVAFKSHKPSKSVSLGFKLCYRLNQAKRKSG